ncbi:MAG: IclR family transcriptional regulator [Pseudomonadota bacterium]
MSTIDKAIDVLFELNASSGLMRLSELSESLQMPRSSVHRILATLANRGLVEQDSSGGYRTGYALMALGLGAAARDPLAAISKPLLEASAKNLGETFFLVAPRAGQLVVVEKAEGNGFVRAAPSLGSTVPHHATAVGKLFLAFDSHFQAAELKPYTKATIRSRKKLKDAIEQVRAIGWASNLEEWQPGLSVVAAPVLTEQGIVGAVALAMVTARMEAIGIKVAVRHVRHAAEGLTLRIEGQAP